MRPNIHLQTAALIYNPGAGSTDDDEAVVNRLRALLRKEGFDVRVFEAETDAEIAAATALVRVRGMDPVIACGGDGTLETVANGLVGTPITLGILPAGTRNNVAAGLKIPTDFAAAVSLLRNGRRRAVDMVHARCGSEERWFLEVFAAGILSTVFEDAEAAQKGNLGALGNLVAKFVGASPSVWHLTVDDGSGTRTLELEAHAVLGMNMPFVGANFRVANDIIFDDGYMDLFLYDQLNKLDLLAHGIAVMTDGGPDPRIRRLRTRHLVLHADPPVPVMVDGVALGEGPVTMTVHQRALHVMTGLPSAA